MRLSIRFLTKRIYPFVEEEDSTPINSHHVYRVFARPSLDKSALLVSLLRAKNIPAQIMLGEILMRKNDLKGLYGVEGDLDLFWAHWFNIGFYFKNAQGQTDASLIVHNVNGELLWAMPHAWVRAYINNQWVTLDPTGPFMKVISTMPDHQRFPISVDLVAWLTQPDDLGRYVKPGNLFDQIHKNLRTQLGEIIKIWRILECA